jgi:hypothetical protein
MLPANLECQGLIFRRCRLQESSSCALLPHRQHRLIKDHFLFVRRPNLLVASTPGRDPKIEDDVRMATAQ